MKKILTLAAAVLASLSLWAAQTKTYTFDDGVALSTDWTVTTNVPDGGTATCEITTSINSFAQEEGSTKYLGLAYLNKSNIGITIETKASYDDIEEISFDVIANDNSKPSFAAYIVTSEGDVEVFAAVGSKDGFGTGGTNNWGSKTVQLASNKSGKLKIVTVASSSGKYAAIDNIKIKHTPAPTCTDPNASIIEDAAGFVGDAVDLEFSSSNTNDVAWDVKKGEADAVENTDFAWVEGDFKPLVAGTFVITATQTADATYCAVDESVTLTISEKTPVTAVTVDGPEEGVIGQVLTYTATATGATAYEWYLDDVKQGSDSAKFIYTAVKGDHSIVCKARNDFNEAEEWISSDAKAVTITKLCGELIKAVHTDKTTATVTGVVGGTVDKSTASDGKFGGKGQYFGLTLASGTFMAADEINVNLTTAGQQGTIAVYADKNGSTLLFSADSIGAAGDNKFVLPASVNGKSTIYVCRTEANTWNGYVNYISVSRSCEESDNNNATVTINGEAAEKSGTVFNYTLSASYTDPTVAVEITLEHPLATLMEEHAATFTMPTPEVGTPSVETFKVKAENGEQAWYSIFVNKSAALSSNADLSALSVAGLTLSPDFAADVTEYTVTKAYEAAMPTIGDVTATPADANAKGAEVTIAGNVITVTVTAENDDTKEYTITVNNAPALKSLSQVKFANGFDAFIDNTNHTVKAFYLAGDAAPEAAVIVAGNGTAGPLSEGKIVVTGADDSTVDYIVTLEAVTPNTDVVEEAAAAGVFDGTEAWVKGGLHISDPTNGFSSGKYVLRRQLKSGDAANDQRVIAGFVRAYFFVGNASKFELTQTGNKGVKYAIDGGEAVEASGDVISIALEEGNHVIEIVTNQQKGNCELSAPKLVKRPETPTAIDNANVNANAVKRIVNGQLVIEFNGRSYNILGTELK